MRMLVAGHLEGRLNAPSVQTFVTDFLDEQAVARAREGCYSSAEIADLPDAARADIFIARSAATGFAASCASWSCSRITTSFATRRFPTSISCRAATC